MKEQHLLDHKPKHKDLDIHTLKYILFDLFKNIYYSFSFLLKYFLFFSFFLLFSSYVYVPKSIVFRLLVTKQVFLQNFQLKLAYNTFKISLVMVGFVTKYNVYLTSCFIVLKNWGICKL